MNFVIETLLTLVFAVSSFLLLCSLPGIIDDVHAWAWRREAWKTWRRK